MGAAMMGTASLLGVSSTAMLTADSSMTLAGAAIPICTVGGFVGGVTYGMLSEALVDPGAKHFYNPNATLQSIGESGRRWGARGAVAGFVAGSIYTAGAMLMKAYAAKEAATGFQSTRQVMRTVANSPATRQFLRPLKSLSSAQRVEVIRWLRESRLLRIAQEKAIPIVSQPWVPHAIRNMKEPSFTGTSLWMRGTLIGAQLFRIIAGGITPQ